MWNLPLQAEFTFTLKRFLPFFSRWAQPRSQVQYVGEIPVDYIEPDITDEIIVVFPLWAGNMPPGVKTFVDTVGKERISGICKENLLIFASKEKIVPWKRQRQMRTALSPEHINPGRT